MRRSRSVATRLTVVVAVAVAALGLVAVPAAPSPGGPAAPGARPVAGTVLVRSVVGAPPSSPTAADRAAGASVVRTSRVIPGLRVVRVPDTASALAAYRADPSVQYAEVDQTWGLDVTPDDPRFGDLWGLHNTGQAGGTPDADIDAPEAWEATTGTRRVAVAVVDTGITLDHPDLARNVFSNAAECAGAAGVDDDANGWTDDCHGIDARNGDADPTDDHGHGTHVAGTIGAVGDNGVGVTGVNWAVSIVPCKSHDLLGNGTTTSVVECMEYLATLADAGVRLVAANASWGGCPEACTYSQALADAIAALGQRGVLFVASAGNDDLDNDTVPKYPTNYDLPNVISVAATTRTDALASYSNHGDRTVDLGAPGSSVLSTYPGGYEVLSGTSMASPHVTGVAALLEAAVPTRDWRAIRNLILSGADPIASLQGRTVTGRRLNAGNAVACKDRRAFGMTAPLDRVRGGQPTTIAALHVECAAPAGPLSVTIEPGGTTLALKDRGTGADQAAGDGVLSARWNAPPVTEGTTYTLHFSNGETRTVSVTP